MDAPNTLGSSLLLAEQDQLQESPNIFQEYFRQKICVAYSGYSGPSKIMYAKVSARMVVQKGLRTVFTDALEPAKLRLTTCNWHEQVLFAQWVLLAVLLAETVPPISSEWPRENNMNYLKI